MTLEPPQIIGRGTWLDKIAADIVEREKTLGRAGNSLRVESGLGASGIPHIGSFGDAARAHGVRMALENIKVTTELIAFSDDMDGLRRVPTGFPKSLSKYLGFPVSSIPDPFGCHESYGQHMGSLLLDSLDKTGIVYRAVSGTRAYKEGLFNEQIDKILRNAARVGQIIKETLGQEKYTETLPYFPVCKNCGRIYTTKALEYIPERHVVTYVCQDVELRAETLKGCGHRGEVDVRSGEGKLSWKVEFAARWSALRINYEAYGKDLTESVRANDRVMEEVLGEAPPFHTRYEHFIDKTGSKISKSVGNVIAPQLWLKYGPPQSLLLLMFKRSVGSRAVWVKDIPTYIGELDELDDTYFGRKQVKDPKSKESEFVREKLASYGYKVSATDPDFLARLERALNWARDIETISTRAVNIEGKERDAVLELAGVINASNDEAYLQNVVFTMAKKHGLQPGSFFKTLYRILIGADSGPRLGPYILAMGRENVAAALVAAARTSKE